MKAKETNVLRQDNTFPIIATNYHKTILNILLRQTETPINQLKETLKTTTSKTRGEPTKLNIKQLCCHLNILNELQFYVMQDNNNFTISFK